MINGIDFVLPSCTIKEKKNCVSTRKKITDTEKRKFHKSLAELRPETISWLQGVCMKLSGNVIKDMARKRGCEEREAIAASQVFQKIKSHPSLENLME